MTKDAVVLALAACLAAGWYGARLLQAARDVTGAKARLDGAKRVAGRARVVAAVAGLLLAAIVYIWIHQHGG